MLGWLKSLWNWGISGIDDLWRKFLSVIQSVYSFIDGWINSVVAWANQLWNDFTQFAASVVGWVNGLIQWIQGWVIRLYNDVEQWVSSLWNQLYQYIQDVYHWILGQVANLIQMIENVWSSIVNWVIQNIWDPLYNFISGVYQWVVTNGYWMFYLLTHPDQLAKLLGEYILREWINLSKKYAGVVGRWLVHSMLSAGHDVGDIIASVIASII